MKKMLVLLIVGVFLIAPIGVEAVGFQERFEEIIAGEEMVADIFPAIVEKGFNKDDVIEAEENRGSALMREEDDALGFGKEDDFFTYVYFYEFDNNDLEAAFVQIVPKPNIVHKGETGDFFVLMSGLHDIIMDRVFEHDGSPNIEINREIGSGSLNNQIDNERIDFLYVRDLMSGYRYAKNIETIGNYKYMFVIVF